MPADLLPYLGLEQRSDVSLQHPSIALARSSSVPASSSGSLALMSFLSIWDGTRYFGVALMLRISSTLHLCSIGTRRIVLHRTASPFG